MIYPLPDPTQERIVHQSPCDILVDSTLLNELSTDTEERNHQLAAAIGVSLHLQSVFGFQKL